MSSTLKKKIFSFCLYALIALSIEVFLYVYLGWGVFPKYFMFNIALILFLSFIIFASRPTWLTNTLISLFLAMQIFLAYMNILVFKNMGTVFSLNMLGAVYEAANANKPIIYVWPIIFFAGVAIVTATTMCLIRMIKPKSSKKGKHNKWLARTIVAAGLALSMLMYSVQAVTLYKPKEKILAHLGDDQLYNTFSNTKTSLQRFGSFSFYFNEIIRKVVKPKPLNTVTMDDIHNYMTSTTYNPEESDFFGLLKQNGIEDNIIAIVAESFEWYSISPELTPVLYAMANGYDLEQVLSDFYDFDNQIDVFEGYSVPSRKDFNYNSVTGFTLKPDFNAQTVWNSYDSKYGALLPSYYSNSKTNYTETSLILGNYPYNANFTSMYANANVYQNNNYGFSLPNMLKNSGYLNEGNTYYYHTFEQGFYARNELYSLFGFDNLMFIEEMIENNPLMLNEGNMRDMNSILDSQFMYLYLNDFIHLDENGNAMQEAYFNMFMTLTSHGNYPPYNSALDFHYTFVDATNWLGKEQYESDNDPNGTFYAARTYYAACLDTEYMMAILINGLIESGQLDNTSILFMSDHNSYFAVLDTYYKPFFFANSGWENNTLLNEIVDLKNVRGTYSETSPERYSIPCFIWSKDIPRYETSKFVITFDLLPTILTLCGVNYNPRYYMGYSLFEEAYGNKVLVSPLGKIFNARIMSEDGLTDTFRHFASSQEVEEFSLDVAEYIERWFFITEIIYTRNLFEMI